MTTSTQGQCVYKSTASSGHIQKVYVMYHATSVENAISIMEKGFQPSTLASTVHGMILGQGVYVSRDLNKVAKYGEVVFKLLVYPGRTCSITTSNKLLRSTWQQSYDSAWIPPQCGNPLVPSGLEENCVRDPSHILVLEVVSGQYLLRQGVKILSFQQLPPYFDKLSPNQQENLAIFTESLRLGHFYLRNSSTGKLLCVEEKSRRCCLVERVDTSTCTCHALWSLLRDTTLSMDNSGPSEERTGSFCSKLSGRVLTVKTREDGMLPGEVKCYMADFGINYPIWTKNTMRCQEFTSGTSGELFHRASGQFLTITRDVNNNDQRWVGLGHGRDYWEFVYEGLCPVCDRKDDRGKGNN
eukprot:GFUD01029299.1.p1 GENE.GFUD01029299.1~~GFUD01029299.1.p1  ORF type:complete len:355 (+),score=85.68 GFUD01029299.1:80-1144(+)